MLLSAGWLMCEGVLGVDSLPGSPSVWSTESFLHLSHAGTCTGAGEIANHTMPRYSTRAPISSVFAGVEDTLVALSYSSTSQLYWRVSVISLSSTNASLLFTYLTICISYHLSRLIFRLTYASWSQRLVRSEILPIDNVTARMQWLLPA